MFKKELQSIPIVIQENWFIYIRNQSISRELYKIQDG
jgi:hypothetical protein